MMHLLNFASRVGMFSVNSTMFILTRNTPNMQSACLKNSSPTATEQTKNTVPTIYSDTVFYIAADNFAYRPEKQDSSPQAFSGHSADINGFSF